MKFSEFVSSAAINTALTGLCGHASRRARVQEYSMHTFINHYLDVQVHRGGSRPGSNVHTEVLVLCMWQVAIILICVYLDVQVHRGGCRPGSNVHITEVDSGTRIPLFVFF